MPRRFGKVQRLGADATDGTAPGTRLILVGAAVTLLLATLAIGLTARGYQRERERVIAETVTSARASATDADQLQTNLLDLLQVLAAAPQVRAGDPQPMRLYLLNSRPVQRGFTGGLAWFDAQGRLRISSASDLVGTAPPPTPDYVQQVLATGMPVVSTAASAPGDGRRGIVLAVPTQDDQGRSSGVLTGAIGNDRLEQTTHRLPFGPGSTTWVFDRAGQALVVPVTGGVAPNLAGTPLWAQLQPRGGDPFRGGSLVNVEGIDGTAGRLVGFAWTPAGDLLLVVERSSDEALASLLRSLLIEILALGVVAAFCLGVLARVGVRMNRLAAAERAAQRQYRTLAEVAPVGIFHADARGNWTYANDRWCAIAGMSPEAARGRGWIEAVHPEDRARVLEAWAAVGRAGHPFQAEYRFLAPDGTITWGLSQAWAERDAAGAVIGYVGTVTDISAREAVATALRASEEKFATAFALSPLALSLTSIPEGRYLEVNEALLRMAGYSREEVIGRTPGELGIWADPDAWVSGRRTIVEGGRSFQLEARFRRKGGSILVGLISGSRITLAGQPAVLSVIADITARKEAESREALLAEVSATLAGTLDEGAALDALARLLVRDLADWCVISTLEDDGQFHRRALAHVDPAREVTLRQLAPVYPYEPDQIGGPTRVVATGQSIFLPALAPEEFLALAKPDNVPIFRALGIASMMIIPLRARGHTFGSITLIRATAGRPFTAAELALAEQIADRAAITIDSARLYAAERAARAAAEAAVATRDRFLSIAAHELRTPLTSVRAYTQLLQRRAKGQLDPAQLSRSLDSIERGTGRLDALIQDLLDVARLQSGQLRVRREPLDLVAVVEGVIAQEQLHLPERLTLVADLAVTSFTVDADAGRLEQVLGNLLENARKYSPDGGTVRVALTADAEGATIAVRDEGIGLGLGDAEAIFTPFSRTEESLRRQIPGLGLGLAICRAIIEQHGGTLSAASAGYGQGTTFALWLPAYSK